MSKCSIDEFKFALDSFLTKIPDEPSSSGVGYTLGWVENINNHNIISNNGSLIYIEQESEE